VQAGTRDAAVTDIRHGLTHGQTGVQAVSILAESPPPEATKKSPVGGPVWVGWREGTLTRAKELESLCDWVCENNPQAGCEAISEAIRRHLEAAGKQLRRLNGGQGNGSGTVRFLNER
jgi:hypothetical protein